jgi:septum formation protein
MWCRAEPLLLASRSAARRRLLEAAGLPVEVLPADVDERAIERDALPASADRVAAVLARAKAEALIPSAQDRVVIAADQTLACGGRIYAKPESRESAREQLASLSGRAHQLHSAVAVAIDGRIAFEHVATAQMRMRALSAGFMELYLDRGGPAVEASVGGYQLEGLGVHLFEGVEGDYFTILGLPLLPLLAFFRRAGLVAS